MDLEYIKTRFLSALLNELDYSVSEIREVYRSDFRPDECFAVRGDFRHYSGREGNLVVRDLIGCVMAEEKPFVSLTVDDGWIKGLWKPVSAATVNTVLKHAFIGPLDTLFLFPLPSLMSSAASSEALRQECARGFYVLGHFDDILDVIWMKLVFP